MRIIKTPANIAKSVENALAKQATEVAAAIDGLMKQVGPLNALHERLTGRPYMALPSTNGRSRKTTTATATRTRGGRRKRRNADQLKAHAKAVADFITAGKDVGRSGAEVKKRFPDLGPGMTIKAFVQKYAGETVRTKGQKAAMRYFNVKG